MKPFLVLAAALTISACAPVPNTSQSLITRPLLNQTTVGGPGYPVVISGAESVGQTPVTIAQNLRFPARLSAGSSFRAATDDEPLVNHAHLDIAPSGESTLTFLHGERRTGVGTFTLPPAAYGSPQALGSTSAGLIDTMLRDARSQSQGRSRIRYP